MNIFYTTTTDPAFNLALEEYLFSSTDQSWFFLWQNENAVIIGKNQVALREVDSALAAENGTKIIRRMTGGGAVYHDMGNVNYSYIVNSEDNAICFERYTRAIIRYLENLGVKAEFTGRNDILVEGKKISGNAQHIKNGRILHHGTLLFNADLQYASKVLTPDSKKINSRGVSSVKSRITNIKDHLTDDMDTELFISSLLQFITSDAAATPCEPNEEQIGCAKKLCEERYATFGWNFGTSPQYDFSVEKRFDFGTVSVTADIQDGNIKSIAIIGDFFGNEDITILCERLSGCRHEREEIASKTSDISDFIYGMNSRMFLELLF